MALAIFGIPASTAHAQTYTVIHAFSGGRDGEFPYAGVTLDAAGNIYGATQGGGIYHGGTVFEIDPSGQQIVLYDFQASPFQRAVSGPDGSLLRSADGTLYGTTIYGGNPFTSGTAFALSRSGRLKVWRNLPGEPFAGLIADPQGNLYGTTAGAIFEVTNNQVQTIYNFPNGAEVQCLAPLLRDASGNLYGTTEYGGIYNLGTVFKLDPSGNETVIHSFAGGMDGKYPTGGLIEDAFGNLYGTTGAGYISDGGTIFKVDPSGNETILYGFTGGSGDGFIPTAGLTADPQGNLYGTTIGVYGNVFKLDTAGKLTVLYRFMDGTDGGTPYAGVVRDQAGNLYGTTFYGGDLNCPRFGCGVVYKITP